MAPCPQKPTMKERILETADRLFYLQGIRAVGVDTIAAEIGISKRTLYNHFPSKDDLIAAYLERRFRQPRPSDKPPAEQILGTFDSLERRFAGQGFSRLPVRQRGRRTRRRRSRRCKKIAIAFKESRRVWFRDLSDAARRRRCGRSGDAADAAGRRLDRAGSGARRSRRWRAPRRKPRGCCWRMRGLKSTTTHPRRPRESRDPYAVTVQCKQMAVAISLSAITAGGYDPAFAGTMMNGYLFRTAA